jgi:hypothetical protein
VRHLEAPSARDRGGDLIVVHRIAEMLHDGGRATHRREGRMVLVAPAAQDQPLGLDHAPSSRAAWAAW